MDCHFNLRRGTQKKFKMSPFLPGASFARCFSTKVVDSGPCRTDTEAVKPMLDMLTDFHSQQMPLNSANLFCSSSKTGEPMATFSNSSLSLSYVVGGFVTKSQPGLNSPQNMCDILEVLVSSFQNKNPEVKMKDNKKDHFPNLIHPQVICECKSSFVTTSPEMVNQKRTYADVAKGRRQKSAGASPVNIPANLVNVGCSVNRCSNCTVYTPNSCRLNSSFFNNLLSQSSVFEIPPKTMSSGITNCDTSAIPAPGSSLSPGKPISGKQPFEESGPCLKPQLKLSLGSLTNCRVNRTLSECSVDSDDSFIVFQNEGDPLADCTTEEESSDDSDEVDKGVSENCGLPSPVDNIEKKNKRVRFKPEEELVRVHPMVAWDYAHRAARVGPWESYARDRARFQHRVAQLSDIISPVLHHSHRAAVYNHRFTNST